MTLYNAALTRTLLYRELLRGPLYYVLVLLFSVLVFWRESPIGVVSLSMMSGGDGILHKLASLILFCRTSFHLVDSAKYLHLLGP